MPGIRKKKQKPKKGRVIRISDQLAKAIDSQRGPDETWAEVIARITNKSNANPKAPSMWTLPSRLVPTKGEALGIAIVEAAREGRALDTKEEPIKVFEG